jgi:hypothetical protein
MIVARTVHRLRSVSSIAGSGFASASAQLARSAYKVANVNASRVEASPKLAAPTPAGIAREEMARQASPLAAVPYHGEAGAVADVSRETIEQIGTVNAYKTYLAVFRADDEIQGSLLRIKA